MSFKNKINVNKNIFPKKISFEQEILNIYTYLHQIINTHSHNLFPKKFSNKNNTNKLNIKQVIDTIKEMMKYIVTKLLILTEEKNQMSNYIIKLENDIRKYISELLENKNQKEIYLTKLEKYLIINEEYEKLKEKVKYKQGKFLNDDKKENEIFILQQENSNLKGEIKKLEKKIKEYKDINIRIFDSPNKSMNLNLSKYSNSNQIINNNIIINSYHKKYPSLSTKQKSKEKSNVLNTSYSYSNKKPFKKKGNNMNKTNKTMNLFFKDKTKNRVIKNV